MAHDVPNEYNETARAQVNAPINLYTVYDYDGGGNNLYFAQYKEDVVFDGVTYTKFPIAMSEVSENVQGEIDTVKIKIANVSREIQWYIENYDFTEKKVEVKQVWADQLSDTDNVMSYIFYIDRYVSTEKEVTFECSSKFDVADVETPFGRFMRGICRWKVYKGSICLAVSELATCNRTMANCRERNNILRYGACPSIPSQRIYVS